MLPDNQTSSRRERKRIAVGGVRRVSSGRNPGEGAQKKIQPRRGDRTIRKQLINEKAFPAFPLPHAPKINSHGLPATSYLSYTYVPHSDVEFSMAPKLNTGMSSPEKNATLSVRPVA